MWNRCAQHPNRETNLRCGRCNNYICSKCIVESFVGVRCNKCVSSGKHSAVTANTLDLIKALSVSIVLGFLAGILFSFITGGVLSFMQTFTQLLNFISLIGNILVTLMIMLFGIPAGVVVRRASGNKIDNRIRYIAAFSVLIAYSVTGLILYNLLNINVLLSIYPIIGLVMGTILALQRAR